MMSISEGAKQETLRQIELMGANNIIIQRNQIKAALENSATKFSPGLNLRDGESLKKLLTLIEYEIPQKEITCRILYETIILNNKVIGTTPAYPLVYNSKILLGKFLKKFHLSEYANVCVIGFGIKQKLFKSENPLNKEIKIGDQWFQVIGVMAPKDTYISSENSLNHNFNDDIYVPITTMLSKMRSNTENRSNGINNSTGSQEHVNIVDRSSVDQITVKVINVGQLKEAAYLINKILELRHYGVKDYSIILPEEILSQKQKTQRTFNIVMSAIAGISLLVGGIGIMNIMLANMLERTKEIGLRRAVGATKSDVLFQFISEALAICTAGGILGILLGFLLAYLISTYADWETVISSLAILYSFLISLSAGLIFGIYPAKKAAEKNPIDSLRYE